VQGPQIPDELEFGVAIDDNAGGGEVVTVIELGIKAAAFTSLAMTKKAYLTAIVLEARSSTMLVTRQRGLERGNEEKYLHN